MRFKFLSSAALIAASLAGSICYGMDQKYGKLIPALDGALWEKSEWISAADAPVITGKIVGGNERAADGASWFVCDPVNAKKVVSAKWMTTGLGVYRLYVNGKEIGEEILKPGFTHYGKTKVSFTYDITDVFVCKKGASNRLAVQSTPGWWADKIVTPPNNEGMIGKKPAFRGVLELCYSDGRKEYFGTNCKDWKAGIAGPVTHAAIFDGEEYDARILPGYLTPEKLGTPEINREFGGKIVPTEGAEIYLLKDIELAPQKMYVWEEVSGNTVGQYGKVVIKREYSDGDVIELNPGEKLVIDFGQNCAAVPEFVFKADEGTVLTFLPAELLNDGNGAESRGMDGPEGSVHRTNLRIPEYGMKAIYTFAGDKDYVSYRPECTFFGYRFASIECTGKVRISSLRSVPVSSISEDLRRGFLETGNEDINKLISNTLWGQRSNYLSVSTDCPQRNERLGWTADTQVFTETGTFFADTRRFFHKWMRDMRDTQNEKGGFPGVAPLAQYGAEPTSMMRLGWADAGIIVPWTVWKQFDDVSIVDENWEAMDRFMQHIYDTKYDHKTLLEENGDRQWADWLSYEPLESCSRKAYIWDKQGNRHPTPDALIYWNFLSACYWATNADMMSDMARASGRDAERYARMAEEARQYIRENFIDEKGNFHCQILNTMQTPALFELRAGVVSGEAKSNVCARLRKNIEDKGNCLQTGFLGTSILMSTLTENGMVDLAYEILLQHKNPSWLYSIDNGATTIWERWNSYMLDKGMGPKGMNSFNHYAYGCVCEWIWETAAGISSDPAEPGFRHIIMKPVPDRRLGYVKASLNTNAGPVSSEWWYEDENWVWEFSIPEGAHASVTLPGESSSTAFGPGHHRIEKSL